MPQSPIYTQRLTLPLRSQSLTIPRSTPTISTLKPSSEIVELYHIIQNRFLRLAVITALAAVTVYAVIVAVGDTGLPKARFIHQTAAVERR